MPTGLGFGRQLAQNVSAWRNGFGIERETPLNRIFGRPHGGGHDTKSKNQALHVTCAWTRDSLQRASSSSMRWLILPAANSAATRIVFLIAFALERPCVIMHTPVTPSNGAPPYSE